MSHVGQKSRKRAMWAKNNLSHQFLQLNEVLNSFSFSSIPSILCALMIDPPAATSAIAVLKLEPEQIMV